MDHLARGVEEMGLSLQAHQLEQLLLYVESLVKWNRAYNLSAIRDPVDMVYRHLLDSLALLPFLENFIASCQSTPVHLLDVGSGAGLPGIPLAIACTVICPQLQFTLVDSNGKKTRFLFQVKTRLDLENVKIENNRVEKFSPSNKFAIVTSRAYSSLAQLVEQSTAMLHKQGEFWAMKGQYPHDELKQCANIVSVHPLTIPGLDSERHLVRLRHPHRNH
ncbi:MAG: 16S rRNA (guanine(527)-N(7))-methyltransferase RsmG [Cellvibrionaceae bacterium]|nr:16S rRNA (guanine(527)-N(7))-methyltransferase RsmG [Cellvibrionaceae bacterium]